MTVVCDDRDPIVGRWSPQEYCYRKALYAAIQAPLMLMDPTLEFDVGIYTLKERLSLLNQMTMHEISRMEAVDGEHEKDG